MQTFAILGTGLTVPQHVVTNAEFDERYGRDVGTFLRERLNIHERRFMATDEATSDLAIPAAVAALDKAGIAATDLDLIIVATDTPDQLSPATAAIVQHRLGATRAGTFDLNAACAGFVTAVVMADAFLKADDRRRHALIIGAYGMSKFLDWADFKTATVFADGAGAVVLGPARTGRGVIASQLATDGQYHSHMGIYGGGTRRPLSQKMLNEGWHKLRFVERIPPEMNVAEWPPLIRALMDRAGGAVNDLQRLFFTQINVQSIRLTMAALSLPESRAHLIMQRFGYTGSACLPMALADAAQSHLLKRGDLIALVASGGGVATAGAIVEWDYDT